MRPSAGSFTESKMSSSHFKPSINPTGALLNHFINPIYLDSLILGSLFHGDHLSRAVYGRLEVVEDLKTDLPDGKGVYFESSNLNIYAILTFLLWGLVII